MPNILFLGPVASGKTQILARLMNESFNEKHVPTVGYDFRVYGNDDSQKSQIWDASGNDQEETIKFRFRSTLIALYCVDLSGSFDMADFETQKTTIKQHGNMNMKVILVGTKSDLDSDGKNAEALKAYAQSQKLDCFIISAKDNANIDALRDVLFPQPKAQPKPETQQNPERSEAEDIPLPNPQQTPEQLFCGAAMQLENTLTPFPAQQKKMKREMATLKKILLDTSKTPGEKKQAFETFHKESLAILNHKRHPALNALLAFTAFVFFTFFVAAIGFTIMGLATGIWAPAAFIAALTVAHPGAIAVVSTAAVSGMVGGVAAAKRFFTASVPSMGQTNALNTFENYVKEDFRIANA